MPGPDTRPDPAFLKALAANRKGDKAEARRLLEALVETDSDHADALEVLGMLVSEEGDLDRAIALTERLLALRPQSIMAHANLSRFHMLKGDKETAEDWQSKARVLGWQDEIRRKGGDPAGGGAGLQRGPDPETVTRQEQNVEAHPADARARLQLAGSYARLEMHAKAIPHLRHALSVDPQMSVLYLELGKALEHVGGRAEAAELYARGIPLADAKGDLMPRNQMQTRLSKLQKETRDDG
jgi:tetratricopeptide (TPR) repeat protein